VKATRALFLATLFCVTWEKVHWNVAGAVGIADVLTILFLVAFAIEWGDSRVPRSTIAVLALFATLLLIYLLGFFDISDKASLDQWVKGMVKFVLHFLFLAAAVAYLWKQSAGLYWRAVAAFTAGLVANSAYGALQLLAARGGVNLDQRVLSPLTGGASSINVYGAVNGQNIYRPNALTGDPNHLADMLACGRPRLPLPRDALHALSERRARARRRAARARDPVRAGAGLPCSARPAHGRGRRPRRRRPAEAPLLRGRDPVALRDERHV
jgi:hypothetical protein